MTNCWPSALLSAVATARVRMSVLMPGGNGQITVTGRTGHGSAASAGVAAIMKAVAIQTAARSIMFASVVESILPSAGPPRKPQCRRARGRDPRSVSTEGDRLFHPVDYGGHRHALHQGG